MNRRTALTACAAFAALPLIDVRTVEAESRPGRRRGPRGSFAEQCREDANLAVMRRWIENLTSGRGADNAQFKSPDMTVTVPDALPYGGTLPDAEYGAALANFYLPPSGPPAGGEELFADTDKVFLKATFSAVGASTGTAFDVPLLEVFTLRDGLVVNDTIYYFDLDVLLAALGIS